MINWLEWSKESFEKARKSDKPVLLDLTAVWCHWCHIMDSTSYSNGEIAKIINHDFVPIKVYIDKRPDIRDRYNMGGFPSTVFLTPEGDIIAGETYVPPERLKLLLETVKSCYKDKKIESKKKAIVINEGVHSMEESKTRLNENIVNEILLSIEYNFDGFYGGFGIQPKFPNPEVIDLLFLQYRKTTNEKYLDIALKTLDGIHEGLYDKIGFGFFRYSVTQDWKMPHYEKMLDTNAGLLRNYATAFDITKNDKYGRIASETISYINKFLSDQKKGGFYGSQDADEEFYNLKFEERKKRAQPYVDKTLYVDWSSIMVSSYIKSGKILNDNATVEFAMKTVDLILEEYYDSKNGLRHFLKDDAHISGLLGDNLHFLNCLIDAYSITKNDEHLKKIKEIAEFILKKFYDSKNYGFFDRILKKDDIGILRLREKAFLENSFCAVVFLRLYLLTEEGRYKQAAENTLLCFSGSYLNFGYFAATYAIAVDMLLNNDIKI